ncbi:uncharacterized protein N7525_004373, partial [Penicillium rubens]|uniref:uncharacterized protein n=1 Tax=Penicillium rubens TaxID=1108849 RepID=UPI002A5A91C3
SANPKPCRCSTEETAKKKLAHRPKRSQRRTALLVKLLEPIASESCCLAPIFPAMSLGLRKVTNALSHVFGRQTGSRRGGVGMLERCGLVSGSEGARAKPTGNNISASPPLSTGAFGEKPEPKFDVSMQSLKPSNNRTVEACDIYLPDDSLAVDGM